MERILQADLGSGIEVRGLSAARVPLRFWLLPITAAFIYPLFLDGYSIAARSAVAAAGMQRGLLCVLAATSLLLAILVPCTALAALLRLDTLPRLNLRYLRRLLHVLVATPPLYILSSQIVYVAGMSHRLNLLWWVAWALMAMLSFRILRVTSIDATSSGKVSTPARAIAAIRVTHGFAAACLLIGFISLHLANHLSALWSLETQKELMITLRLWYRSAWVEPGILGLCAVMIVSGLPLLAFHTRVQTDRYRRMQTAAGGYLVAFLLAHVAATLWVRSGGMETDWVFASGGPAGLIMGASYALIPYYLLSVLAVAAHVALGLRIVLLGHHAKAATMRRVVVVISVLGATLAVLIVAALLGVHIRG